MQPTFIRSHPSPLTKPCCVSPFSMQALGVSVEQLVKPADSVSVSLIATPPLDLSFTHESAQRITHAIGISTSKHACYSQLQSLPCSPPIPSSCSSPQHTPPRFLCTIFTLAPVFLQCFHGFAVSFATCLSPLLSSALSSSLSRCAYRRVWALLWAVSLQAPNPLLQR